MADTRRPPPVAHERSLTALAGALPPPVDLTPGEIESYVRTAMHQDRRPGNVLVVVHPHRMYKVPRGLWAAMEQAGFHVETVHTQPDRVASVTGIRDVLLRLSAEDRPLDLVVVSGDGSLDHHVLISAFWAFYPDLVTYRPGAFDASAVTPEDLARLPDAYRALVDPLPDMAGIEPTDARVRELWVLRARIGPLLDAERRVSRVLRAADRPVKDPFLRFAVLAALLPDKVVVRPHGFDLAGLASTTRERSFQGLYPFIRAIVAYPAGTAADNALYAGVPGWGYAQISRLLGPPWLDGLRRRLERRAVERFMDYFLHSGVVVPARCSVAAFDNDWQVISSHAAGGPAAGHFFAADLDSKAIGVLGYLLRAPGVIVREGIFGSTIVRIRAWSATGRLKTHTEGRIAEGLYTNRTFIAGVGSVPSTNPTSFAGQSSLIVVPPIVLRDAEGRLRLDLSGIGTFCEAIGKGILARVLHMVGIGPGTLAGGGRFWSSRPENQVALKEGEELEIAYSHRDGRPRCVPAQVSGDPFQTTKLTIRVAWGPIPLLAKDDSLLMESTRRSLANLRLEQSWQLRSVNIGGLHYFRHVVGDEWSPEWSERTGLFSPPPHLPLRVARVQALLLHRWQRLATGEFVDTSERGLQLGRRGRYAHNNDQTAHLVVIREPRSTLTVRQVRANGGDIYEAITTYRSFGGSFIIHSNQTRLWRAGEHPRILQEEHFFRNADAFRQEAPAFFPFVTHAGEPTLREVTEEIDKP